MYEMPKMITNRTIATLIPVITRLTRDDSLVPSVSSIANTITSSNAPQSTSSPPMFAIVDTPSPKMYPSTTCRYDDQPLDTAAAPTANSRTRSQPMIHAISSPKVAYENVYALPATGTVEANSA